MYIILEYKNVAEYNRFIVLKWINRWTKTILFNSKEYIIYINIYLSINIIPNLSYLLI